MRSVKTDPYKCVKNCFAAAVFAVSFFGFSSQASAEDLYVRPAGSSYGSGNGADWTNAFAGFANVVWGSGAGQLGAGDTLYVAGGANSGRLEIKGSGTSDNHITIKRATVADHGTATGWAAGFDAQVLINTEEGIRSTANNQNYIDIDGVVANGIKIYVAYVAHDAYGIRMSYTCSYWTLSHIEVMGPSNAQGSAFGMRGIHASAANSYITISNCSFHGMSTGILQIGGTDWTVQDTDIYDMQQWTGTTHPDVYYIRGDTSNIIFRRNRVYNVNAQGIYFSGPPEGAVTNVYVYDNLFHDNLNLTTIFQVDLQKYTKGSVHNYWIYHNTIVNTWGGIVIDDTQDVAGGHIENNIFYNVSTNVWNNTEHDYNWFSGANTETHGLGNGTNPFTNMSGQDYSITVGSSARSMGITLASPYDVDILGNTRTAPFDAGAYEYVSGGDTTPPSAPAGLSVS